MWIVWNDEDGIVCTTTDYDEALKQYEVCKQAVKEYVQDQGEFEGCEEVILAKVEKRLFPQDTGKLVVDSEGTAKETHDTYWDWVEEGE